jgi:mannobiose 2-epimerase
MNVDLIAYKKEQEAELHNILSYWLTYSIDDANGGFYGKVDSENRAHPESPKGSVLNSRILWAFSAAYNYSRKKEYYNTAVRAYDYIMNRFTDKEFGGVYWSVDQNGKMLNGKKQVYGLAFCIYGLSEFYKIKQDEEALSHAIDLFETIEKHSYDERFKGYYEAFSRDWQPLSDLRLSEKDANEKKTINTHLHIIEAYASLYEIWPDPFLKTQIENLLLVFHQYMIDNNGHLILFFDEVWNPKLNLISYGHDIEAAWLLQQCAEKIRNKDWVAKMKSNAVKITNAAIEGLDKDGGLWYEFDVLTNNLIHEKHSWPQAEAMIGFMNAYEITGDERYLEHSYHSWQFVKRYLKDKKGGEWFWGVNADYSVMPDQDKAGFWKCPYHNSRACMELIQRLLPVMTL